MKAGSSANFTVNVDSVNGFNGSVNLLCTTSVGGITCTFNPSTLTVVPGVTSTSALTIAVAPGLNTRKQSSAGAFYASFIPFLVSSFCALGNTQRESSGRPWVFLYLWLCFLRRRNELRRKRRWGWRRYTALYGDGAGRFGNELRQDSWHNSSQRELRDKRNAGEIRTSAERDSGSSAIHSQSVCWFAPAFQLLACHPWPCMLLNLRFLADSNPSLSATHSKIDTYLLLLYGTLGLDAAVWSTSGAQ